MRYVYMCSLSDKMKLTQWKGICLKIFESYFTDSNGLIYKVLDRVLARWLSNRPVDGHFSGENKQNVDLVD